MSTRWVLVGVLFAALGCEEPPPKQPLGEHCSLARGEYDRCVAGLYCRDPSGVQNLFPSKAGPIGTCTAYLKEGEGCTRSPAACEPRLRCEKQSGVCRSDMNREVRGHDSRETM